MPHQTKTCELAKRSARTALAVRARNLRQLVDEVRAEEVEGIHQMRVASRRLRAALTEFSPVTGPAAAAFTDQARAVTRALGRARELDVMTGMLLEQRGKESDALRPAIAYGLRQLRSSRQAETGACVEAAETVASEAYADNLRLLLDGLSAGEKCHLRYVRVRLRKREKSLRRLFRLWENSDKEAQLHQVRIGFKKLRYACEVHADLYGKAMSDYLGSLKNVQQILGDWNDCRLLRDELQAMAQGAPGYARRMMPRLIRFWDKRATAHLNRFHRKAPKFFDKKHVRRARALFEAPTAVCDCGAGCDT